MAAGLSIVAGGAASARFGPAEYCAPAKAGARPGEAVGALRASGALPSQGHWSLPRPERPTLSELFATHPRDGGATGFLLAQLERGKPLMWVQERMAIFETGRIYPPGLPALGPDFGDIIHVEAGNARAALWAMEEGLRCAALGAVIGELWGDPRALDFTATRRLAVAAEKSGVSAWLVRFGATPNLSGARMRWRIASAPSPANPFDPRAPGAAAWDAELFRARGAVKTDHLGNGSFSSAIPGRWAVAHDGQANSFHLVAAAGDRAVDEDAGQRSVA